MSSAAPHGGTRDAALGELCALARQNCSRSVCVTALGYMACSHEWASKRRRNLRGAVLARPTAVAFLGLVVVAMARVKGGDVNNQRP